MAKKIGHGAAMENPLVPNRRLRQMYVAMAELRLLHPHLRGPEVVHGEEASRVSTLIGLGKRDLVSETGARVASAYLLGARLDTLLGPPGPGTHSKALANAGGQLLPSVASPRDRLQMACGAALALQAGGEHAALVAYTRAGEMETPEWKEVLRFAARETLPMLFVLLPSTSPSRLDGTMSSRSQSLGVPGVPVEASDPVALFRVAQEALGRIRSDGGPVLIECVHFDASRRRMSVSIDAVAQMRDLLLGRGLVGAAWFRRVESTFLRRLESISG